MQLLRKEVIQPHLPIRLPCYLTQHLTTRADDSHAPPVLGFPEGHSSVSGGFPTCQGLVRFFALRRIKQHAPPLVRGPVNSFEF